MVPGTLSVRNVNRASVIPRRAPLSNSSVGRPCCRPDPTSGLQVEKLVIEKATTGHSSDDHEDDEYEQFDLIHPQSDHSVHHLLS
jgi:hypothetical protein